MFSVEWVYVYLQIISISTRHQHKYRGLYCGCLAIYLYLITTDFNIGLPHLNRILFSIIKLPMVENLKSLFFAESVRRDLCGCKSRLQTLIQRTAGIEVFDCRGHRLFETACNEWFSENKPIYGVRSDRLWRYNVYIPRSTRLTPC